MPQWNAENGVDWGTEFPFGTPLDGFSLAVASADSLPPARRGQDGWGRLRCEPRSRRVSGSPHGEHGTSMGNGRCAASVPGPDRGRLAAAPAVEKGRHMTVTTY
ncbi:hypothetical protein [Salinactinospora qingdaonensis]|uniref:Uncharacterized protein n=1 Tax=Salinactinospora qingdaonensis TaxID=702744 RepID=A0ABP7F9R2_9ACTN